MATLEARFWSYVRKSDGCWIWTGRNDSRGGYFRIIINGKRILVHRFSWELANGRPAGKLFVLHQCDNRACVRPDHLFLGTTQDNTADRQAKQRQARGERQHLAKLTTAQVLEIRREASRSPRRGRAIARRLGLYQSTVRRVIAGITWKHLPLIPDGAAA